MASDRYSHVSCGPTIPTFAKKDYAGVREGKRRQLAYGPTPYGSEEGAADRPLFWSEMTFDTPAATVVPGWPQGPSREDRAWPRCVRSSPRFPSPPGKMPHNPSSASGSGKVAPIPGVVQPQLRSATDPNLRYPMAMAELDILSIIDRYHLLDEEARTGV